MGQWHFDEDNAPVHNSILVTDYLTKMDIKTVHHRPYSSDLAPCEFCLFSQLRLSLWENWDERGCDEGHWHAHRRGLPWGLPEVFGTVQQVHCSWRRLLRSGLEFHVCTINKTVSSKKVWKPIVCTSYKLNLKFYYCENYFYSMIIFNFLKGNIWFIIRLYSVYYECTFNLLKSCIWFIFVSHNSPTIYIIMLRG